MSHTRLAALLTAATIIVSWSAMVFVYLTGQQTEKRVQVLERAEACVEAHQLTKDHRHSKRLDKACRAQMRSFFLGFALLSAEDQQRFRRLLTHSRHVERRAGERAGRLGLAATVVTAGRIARSDQGTTPNRTGGRRQSPPAGTNPPSRGPRGPSGPQGPSGSSPPSSPSLPAPPVPQPPTPPSVPSPPTPKLPLNLPDPPRRPDLPGVPGRGLPNLISVLAAPL